MLNNNQNITALVWDACHSQVTKQDTKKCSKVPVYIKVTLGELHAWSPKAGQRGHSWLSWCTAAFCSCHCTPVSNRWERLKGTESLLRAWGKLRGAQSDAAFPALELQFLLQFSALRNSIPISTSTRFFYIKLPSVLGSAVAHLLISHSCIMHMLRFRHLHCFNLAPRNCLLRATFSWHLSWG